MKLHAHIVRGNQALQFYVSESVSSVPFLGEAMQERRFTDPIAWLSRVNLGGCILASPIYSKEVFKMRMMMFLIFLLSIAIVAPQVEPLGDDIDDSLVKRAVVCDSDLSLQQALETLSQRIATSSPRQVAVDCRTVGILLTHLRVDLSLRYANRDTSKLKPPMSQREAELLKETIQQLLDVQALLLGLEETAIREALKSPPSPDIEKALRAWLKRVDTIKELLSTPSKMTRLSVSDFPKPAWTERVDIVRKISNQLKPFDYSPFLIDKNEKVLKPAKVRVAPPLQRLVEVPLPW